MRRRYRYGISFLIIIVVIYLISSTIGYAIVQGQKPEILHFILTHFAGYLFFILLPVEALIPFYLSAGYSWALLFILSISTALIAQSIDYAIGVLFPTDKLRDFIGHRKYDRAMGVVERYGHRIIFVFCLLPLSSPIVILAAGITKYGYFRTLLYSLAGLTLKYAFIIWFLVNIK